MRGRHWLLIIDNGPIREATLAQYHRLEKRVMGLRVQLDAFESGDLPAYQRWEARAFGPLLTELRSMLQAIDEKRRLLAEIEDEMTWTGCSAAAAYRRVTEAPDAPAPEDEGFDDGPVDEDERDDPEFQDGERAGVFGKSDLPPGFDVDGFDRAPSRAKNEFRAFYKMAARLYEAMTGNPAPTLEEALERERARKQGGGGRARTRERREPAPAPPSIDPAVQRENDRLKELYRTIVRQLHPDQNHEQTAHEAELWHQMQEAYRTRDIERLEAIAGRLEIGLTGKSTTLPIQILMRMSRDLKDAAKALQKQITANRRHPGWAFREKAALLGKFEATALRKQIEEDCREARAELAWFTRHLDAVAKRAERRRAPAKKKRVPAAAAWGQESFPF